MSVRRLIAELDVSTVNVSAFCVDHDIGRSTFYAIRRRVEAEGEAGLEPGSRAPKRVANKTPIEIEELIVELRKELVDAGLDAGPATISWHLQARLGDDSSVPSESTIWRILSARGFITADPSKRPKRSFRSFQAERANQVWQIDGTNWSLADGTEVKIINIIDDGSRYCPASKAQPGETFDAAWTTVCAGASEVGWPARFLCDNGPGLAGLEPAGAALGISNGHSRPYHPQTCGKVERFHQTTKKWLREQPAAVTLAELQTQLDTFRNIYNHHRPHRAIARQTPASYFAQLPKTGPANHPLGQPSTITHGTVAADGRLFTQNYRISVGATWAHQPATTIITGTTATVIIDGQPARQLTINPARTDQPRHPTPGRPPT